MMEVEGEIGWGQKKVGMKRGEAIDLDNLSEKECDDWGKIDEGNVSCGAG